MRTYAQLTEYTTTDAFVALAFSDPAISTGLVTRILAPESEAFGGIIENTGGSNAIKWQLVGVIGDREIVVDSGASVAAGASDEFQVVPYFPEYRLEVAAQTGGNQSTVKASVCLK